MTPIEAGKAFVRFVLDDKGLETKLGSIASKFRKFGSIGLAATTPILVGFAAATASFVSLGSELDDVSQRTGLTAESLSELKFAAEQSGVSLAEIEKAAAFLQKKGIDPARFDAIAGSIASIEDPTKRAQAAMEAFGAKTGRALLPMLAELPQLRAQARALGITLSSEDAAAAAKLGDAFDIAKNQLTAMAVQIGAAIAGPLTNFLEWAQNILAWVIGFVRENPNLVAAIAAVTLGIAAASAAAVTFGVILAVISAHPIIAALTAIAALVIGLATYFGFASDAAGDFSKSLDDIKASTPDISTRSASVQSDLQSAVSGASVRPVSAAAATPVVRDVSQEIARYTRETAEGVARLVAIAKRGGLNGGAF